MGKVSQVRRRVRVRLNDGRSLFVYRMDYSSLDYAWKMLRHLQKTHPDDLVNLSQGWDHGSEEFQYKDIDLSSKDDFMALNAM